MSLIFKHRAISLKLREKIQFFGSGDLAEFEKYAPSKQTAKAVALCGDAKHQTPQPQGGFSCTPYYHLPNHQIQRTRGSDDDYSIPSDDECPKVTYEEEIDQRMYRDLDQRVMEAWGDCGLEDEPLRVRLRVVQRHPDQLKKLLFYEGSPSGKSLVRLLRMQNQITCYPGFSTNTLN